MYTPCHCPEARLFRQVLCGEVPAVDSPTWRALITLVESAAARRAVLIVREASLAISTATDWAATAGNPSHGQLVRRRYPPDGDAARWIAHDTQPCPQPPCTGLDCPHLPAHPATHVACWDAA